MRLIASPPSAPSARTLRRRRAARTWVARLALTVSPLALGPASDSESTSGASICDAAGVNVETIVGSRLLQADRERLELVRGRSLDCQHPRARQVLAGVADALGALHREGRPDPVARQLLSQPLRVHVDPRLPARQAPVAGIEVHVTSGEVLVTSGALGTLGTEVWQHELLHVLAARPPDVPPVARRLWLTLEEGVVEYLAASRSQGDGNVGARPAAIPDVQLEAGPLPPPPRPALALLASPAYDPHPLARALARELERVEPHPALDRWLSCLAAAPSAPGGSSFEPVSENAGPHGAALPGPEALAQVLRLFSSRCSKDTASLLSAALDRWCTIPRPERRPRAQSRSEFSALQTPLR